MPFYLILATTEGVSVCQKGAAGWQEMNRGLADHEATSLIATPDFIMAGTRQGIYRSEDMGQSWRPVNLGLSILHIRWMAYQPGLTGFEYAGTEPAGIYVSDDGGETWRECPEIAEMRKHLGWYLPYSPEAGCVRGFAFNEQRAYAAVEVGGVLVSNNLGESWKLAVGSTGNPRTEPPKGDTWIHPDVHSIEVHPSSADLLCAPTGGGFYRSEDAGRNWELLYDCYCRAAWWDPLTPLHLILGPADGVDRRGRIEETKDGGKSWQLASDGLPVPWEHQMVERFTWAGDELIAVLSNGDLLLASLADLAWRQISPTTGRVNAAAALEI